MEVKYFQNEITNLETHLLALELAILTNNAALQRAVGMELVRTERNVVLSRYQTNSELERMRQDGAQLRELSKAVGSLGALAARGAGKPGGHGEKA